MIAVHFASFDLTVLICCFQLSLSSIYAYEFGYMYSVYFFNLYKHVKINIGRSVPEQHITVFLQVQ